VEQRALRRLHNRLEPIQAIEAERARQDALWGVQDHDLTVWSTILSEETGEFAHEVLELRATDWPAVREVRLERARDELVQVAAVALAAIEAIDRRWHQLVNAQLFKS
jgi:hypothetical protein